MPSTPTLARLAMFGQGNAPFMYCRPRGLNSLWVRSRTVATMRRCSSVSLNRNGSSALIAGSSGGHSRSTARSLSQQAGREEGDDLRRGDHGRRRVCCRLLAVHKTVLGIRIVLPDRGRGALVQRVLERGVGLNAGDMIVPGLDDAHGATDVGGARDCVQLLAGQARVIDRRVGRGAGLDPGVLRGGHERIAAAKTEADHSD